MKLPPGSTVRSVDMELIYSNFHTLTARSTSYR